MGVAARPLTKNLPPHRRRILKLWIARQRYNKKLGIAEKIAKINHISTKRVLNDFYYYKNFLKSNEIVKELDLSDDEINWLREK